MSGPRFAAFGSPAFRRYFVAQIVAQTGMWFQTLAVALVVAERTGSAFALSGVAVATFTPTLAFAWLAGRACDRWSPRRILIASTAVIGAVSPAMIVVLTADRLDLLALYVALALSGSAATFARIAAQSLVFELVGGSLLQNASIWASMMASTARIAGPGLAGATIALVGEAGSLIVNTVLAVVGAILVATIRERDLVPRRAQSGPGNARPARVRLAAPVVTVIAMNGVVCLVAMNIAIGLTAIVTFEFGGDATVLGLSHSLNAIGAVAAALVLTRLRRVTPVVAALGALAFAVGQLLTAAPPWIIVFLGMTGLLGLGMGLFQSGVATAVQTGTPPAQLGRAMSLVNLTSFGALPFGAVLLGALIELLGPRAALAVDGGVCAVVALVTLLMLRRLGRRT